MRQINLMLWSKKHSSRLVTSVKGKKVLDEIMKYGKDKYVESRILNYKSLNKEII